MISFWPCLTVRSANTTSYFEKNELLVEPPGTAISRIETSSEGPVGISFIDGAFCALSGTSGRGSICSSGPVDIDPAPMAAPPFTASPLPAPVPAPPPAPPFPPHPPVPPPPPEEGGPTTFPPPPPREPSRLPPPLPVPDPATDGGGGTTAAPPPPKDPN